MALATLIVPIAVSARFAKGPFHRRAFDAADEARSNAYDRCRTFHVDEAFAQLLIHRANLESRQVRSETDMLASPESDVVVRPSIDAEFSLPGSSFKRSLPKKMLRGRACFYLAVMAPLDGAT